MKRHAVALVLAAGVAFSAAPPARAQADALASAHDALKAGDLAAAAQGHRDYLRTSPDAPDAPREGMHLAFILDKMKAPTAEVSEAFAYVARRYPSAPEAGECLYRTGLLRLREKDVPGAKAVFARVPVEHPGTPGAAMARFSLANYPAREGRFDEAIALFDEIASDPSTPTDMACEAFLETGFLNLEAYFATKEAVKAGKAVSIPDGATRWALIGGARDRLVAVAERLDKAEGDRSVLQTAAAYAECGVAETYLLQGLSGRALAWYARALARDRALVQTPVVGLALQGAGIAHYRLAQYDLAAQSLDEAIKLSSTGKVLYSLRIPDFLTAQARLWRAHTAARLGDHTRALALAREVQDGFGGQEPTEPDARSVWAGATKIVRESNRPAAVVASRPDKADGPVAALPAATQATENTIVPALAAIAADVRLPAGGGQ